MKELIESGITKYVPVLFGHLMLVSRNKWPLRCPCKLYISLLSGKNGGRLHAAGAIATIEAYFSSHFCSLNGLKVYIDELI